MSKSRSPSEERQARLQLLDSSSLHLKCYIDIEIIICISATLFSLMNLPVFMDSPSISMEARKLFILLLLLLHFSSVAVSSNIIRCPETEKDALLKFKQGITNPSNLLSSWTTEQDCCKWEGVECDNTTGHVTTLDLHSRSKANSLRGELRNSLLGLSYLRHLDLSHNDFFYSQIPDFIGSFKNLEYLNLSSANFRGIVPDHLGNLSCLQYLDLSGSGGNLRVNNHDWLSQLSSLKVIDLSWVDLRSWNSWLDAINMQQSLKKLNLSACYLYSIHIPPTLPFLNFTSLQILDLSHNPFGSLIPSWVFNLSSLATLNLKNSEIQGSIPETFQTMTSLTVIDLSENDLTGELPSALPSLLKEVHFSRNRLNGSLTKNIMHLKHLVVLDVARNSLNDTLTQESLNFSDLKELGLSYNSIVLKISQSWIPSFQLDVIALRSCQLGHSFPSWLRTQKTISSIDISDAGISDKVPDWFWDLSPAMEHMDLSFNQLRGEVPDLSRLSLLVVDLSGNNFQGPVPHFSSMMKVFILTNNSFSGTVSPVCESLVYNNSLRFLDLSSNNLSGPLPDCWVNGTELIVLNLGSNFLFGEIPQSLGNLLNLKMLLLDHNNFLGELPSSLQNLRRLTLFDVGSNNLTGSILVWIGEFCIELIILVLRGNQFSGAIPPQLCRLEYLMVLDLSNNALTGTIPRCVNKFLIMAGVEGVPSFIFDQYTAYEKVLVETIIITIFGEYNR
ncbi:PREDICTED: probable leucine-rich repeat receptor-like protein kinase At1g35710 [Ipomoea nil]|uniref:probable leucine-rich repeat receptor-like protein kinase At1g35710 n=1 Tax=Ipomoea nil TaxID=35883 RepID=UPI0009013440|nr:PREDICTED: probable leucine-rich repeat receptor-like protein kinase At1g35710 [Ipomoea nil]